MCTVYPLCPTFIYYIDDLFKLYIDTLVMHRVNTQKLISI